MFFEKNSAVHFSFLFFRVDIFFFSSFFLLYLQCDTVMLFQYTKNNLITILCKFARHIHTRSRQRIFLTEKLKSLNRMQFAVNNKLMFYVQNDILRCTVCPRSSGPFNILSHYIKWGTTSWTYSTKTSWISLID